MSIPNLSNSSVKVFCDGGARGNPGPAAAAFVLYKVQDSSASPGLPAVKFPVKRGEYLGVATNNEAEYKAVIVALTWLTANFHSLITNPITKNQSPITINFFLDSNLVVNQLTGLFKVKQPHLRELLLKIRELESVLTNHYQLLTIDYSYIPRSQNSAADTLVNETLDRTIS